MKLHMRQMKLHVRRVKRDMRHPKRKMRQMKRELSRMKRETGQMKRDMSRPMRGKSGSTLPQQRGQPQGRKRIPPAFSCFARRLKGKASRNLHTNFYFTSNTIKEI